MSVESIDILQNSLLPAVRECVAGGESYDPSHCLAVYFHEPPQGEASLQIPAVIAGEAAAARGGQGCTLLEGFPKKPPGGCLVLGLWDDIQEHAPHLLEGVSRPKEEDGYCIRLNRYGLLAANSRAALLNAAQTLVQLLAVLPSRIVPGVTITDAPLFAERCLYWDATAQQFLAEPFVQLAGLLSSFKVNRLYFTIDVSSVLSGESPSVKMIREWVDVCQEYEISVVPVLSFGAGTFSEEAAQQAVYAVADAFDCETVGLVFDGDSDAERACHAKRFRAVLAAVLADPGSIHTLYIRLESWAFLQECIRSDALELAVLTDALPDETNGAVFDEIRNAGMPLTIVVPSGACGFVPSLSGSFSQKANAFLRQASAMHADGFGFYADRLRDGHLWENDLISSVGCMVMGWSGGDVDASIDRFLALAYAENAAAIRALHESMQVLCQTWRVACNTEVILPLAKGVEPAPAAWRAAKTLAVDESIAAKLQQAEQMLRNCRNEVQRNLGTLDYADIPLAAMRFVLESVRRLYQARDYYAAAGQGRSGSLALAKTEMDSLLAGLPLYLNRWETVLAQTGCGQDMLDALYESQRRWAAMSESLGVLDASQALPLPDALGFPPL